MQLHGQLEMQLHGQLECFMNISLVVALRTIKEMIETSKV